MSSLFSIGSGGAPLTPSLKDQLVAMVPNASVADGFGSSETGAQGTSRVEAGDTSGGVTRFTPNPDTTVLDDATRRPVEPGSGVTGRVALRGRVPLGYYNAPEKTAETFVEIDGVRWVVTGDMATIDDDGTINLLGRGSVSINTGGEKVYPEEVEAVIKAHPKVYDVLVIGVDDERWGQRVAAVVQPVEGERITLDELIAVLPRVAGRLQGAAHAGAGRPDRALAGRQGRLPLGQAHGRRRLTSSARIDLRAVTPASARTSRWRWGSQVRGRRRVARSAWPASAARSAAVWPASVAMVDVGAAVEQQVDERARRRCGRPRAAG